ncbi:hypothetical protein [Bradyrhizobium sp. ARR65]|uniref:hypothetical protein n=1 Tax=Bradyrhizobium sp. ARR65 TaxID=1040989 RepID=UPI000ACB2B06|nr:hypothetical protein [Bradyrhizobium sp. ARR65]
MDEADNAAASSSSLIAPSPIQKPPPAKLRLANAVEPAQDGRIYIEKIKGDFYPSAQWYACRMQSWF